MACIDLNCVTWPVLVMALLMCLFTLGNMAWSLAHFISARFNQILSVWPCSFWPQPYGGWPRLCLLPRSRHSGIDHGLISYWPS